MLADYFDIRLTIHGDGMFAYLRKFNQESK